MHYTRRDAFKVGLFGSAALALPLQRAASATSILDDRMPSSQLPKPFTLPLRIPPISIPTSVHDGEDCHRIFIKEAKAEILPGLPDHRLGLQRDRPRTDHRRQQGQKTKVRFINQLPLKHPVLEVHAVDVGAPARLGVTAASSTATPATSPTPASTRTTTTRTSSRRGRSGTTTTACTTPPRT